MALGHTHTKMLVLYMGLFEQPQTENNLEKNLKNKGKRQNGVKFGRIFAAAAALGLAAGRLAMANAAARHCVS